MKYIDAEKLIERLEEMKQAEYENCGGVNSKTGALQEVQKLIESLQQEQPEVDLEKEIKRFLSNATKMNKGEWRGKYPISDIGFRAVARHFWNKGYNARKGE